MGKLLDYKNIELAGEVQKLFPDLFRMISSRSWDSSRQRYRYELFNALFNPNPPPTEMPDHQGVLWVDRSRVVDTWTSISRTLRASPRRHQRLRSTRSQRSEEVLAMNRWEPVLFRHLCFFSFSIVSINCSSKIHLHSSSPLLSWWNSTTAFVTVIIIRSLSIIFSNESTRSRISPQICCCSLRSIFHSTSTRMPTDYWGTRPPSSIKNSSCRVWRIPRLKSEWRPMSLSPHRKGERLQQVQTPIEQSIS